MNLADARLAPSAGADGLVCRTSGAALFVAARTPVADVARLVERVEARDEAAPARQLARDMAVLVGSDSGTLPGFALVAASEGGIYVKAYGAVEIRVQGKAGEEVITAVGSFTGVDREVTGSFHTIAAHRAGEPVPAPVFDIDLRAGTAPGGGFSLTSLTVPTDAPIDAPPPDATEPGPVTGPDPAPPAEASDPTPPPAAGADGGSPSIVVDTTQAWSAAELAEATSATRPGHVEASGPLAPAPDDDAPAEDDWVSEAPPVWDPPTDGARAEEPPTPPPVDEPATAPPVDEPVSAPPVDEPVTAPPQDEPAPEPTTGGASLLLDEPATMPPTSLPPQEFTSQLLGALDEEDGEARQPLPVDLDPGELRAPDQAAREIMVQGILCSRGHFNDPRSRFCSSCGISMVQNTQILTPGPRPPLGVMVFEDGATFSLSQDYVVGRQPEVSELVRDGLALPLPVDDPERSISRAHAELRLVDWDVHLINLSATNGSFVWDETQQQWIPIPTGQSVLLSAGMRVALGRRSAVFESSLVR